MTTPYNNQPKGPAKTTRVGVGWAKTTQDGRTYLSLVLANPTGPDIRLTVWPVEGKASEASPDYTVTKASDAFLRQVANEGQVGGSGAQGDGDQVPF